jgi:large subunit ribosomal protein L13
MAKKEEIQRNWYVVDAEGQVLGRLASQIATILRGKHKPEFTPHVDCGDHVIVINADKVRLTGKKASTKQYFRHTGYPGGLRSVGFQELIRKRPRVVIERAVWGMLPHNRLGRKMLKKLRVYAGEEHPHQAQKPQALEL